MSKSRVIDGRKYSMRSTPPRGSHSRRLGTLETHIQPAVSQSPKHLTDNEWVDMLRLYAGQGIFDGEPDFPEALAAYEEAIRKTADDPTQHYYPPPEFMPTASPLERERVWRGARDYPAILDAWHWVAAMFSRVVHDEPGLSLAEWQQLRSWFLQESRAWTAQDVEEHLEEISLESLRREVQQDDGKSFATTRWMGLLRKLWAAQYGRTGKISV